MIRSVSLSRSLRASISYRHHFVPCSNLSKRMLLYSTSSVSAPSSTQAPPARKAVQSTLGPDASNPTKVFQPAFSKAGQLLRVDVTENAAKKLTQVRKDDKRPDMVLRIQVESGGCHGFQYVFKLPDASDIKETDSIFERDGSRVVIDHRSLRILRDATIDYTTELIGSQFKVQSPHTSSSCGCGSSFSLDVED